MAADYCKQTNDVPHPFRNDPARAELRALYDEVDRLLSHLSCDASADCCHFARTGREPYPTAVEIAELDLALAGAPIAKKRRLELAGDERRCPVLGDDGRCRAYASRPFGCRTFFCERIRGGKVPRDDVQRIGRRIADLSARFAPRDPGPRPLSRVLAGRR
jgi:Fe-S-cluster containining protein